MMEDACLCHCDCVWLDLNLMCWLVEDKVVVGEKRARGRSRAFEGEQVGAQKRWM